MKIHTTNKLLFTIQLLDTKHLKMELREQTRVEVESRLD